MVAQDFPNGLEAVFLDLDGTLVDTLPGLKSVYFKFLQAYGITGSDDEFAQLNGPSLVEVVATLNQRYQLKQSSDALLTDYLALVEAMYSTAVPPCPGAFALLNRLCSRSYKLALVTSCSGKLVDSVLSGHGWRKYFTAVITGDMIKKGKPDAQIYRTALRCVDIGAERVVAVEDSPNGVIAARDAGLNVIGVSGTADQLIQYGAFTQVPDLDSLALLLCGSSN